MEEGEQTQGLLLASVLPLLEQQNIHPGEFLQSLRMSECAARPILAFEIEKRQPLEGIIFIQIGQVEQQTSHHGDEEQESIVTVVFLI